MAYNGAWRYASRIVAIGGSLVVTGFAFRRLGASPYGVFAIASTAIGMVGTLDSGLSTAVVRATARASNRFAPHEASQARREVEIAHTAYAGLAVIAMSATVVIALAIPQLIPHRDVSTNSVRVTTLLLGAALALGLGTSALAAIPIGRLQYKVECLSTITQTVSNAMIILLLITPWGLIALGLGQVVGITCKQVICIIWLRRHEPWFSLIPRRASKQELRNIAGFALPLLIMSVALQLITMTDVLVIGAVASAAAVASYKIGSSLSSQVATSLWIGADILLPGLSGEPSPNSQERLTTLFTGVLCFLAGLAFCVLILLRSEIILLLVGNTLPIAQIILMVFAGVWIANCPFRIMTLTIMARGRQRLFVPIVFTEAVANISLTIPLGIIYGPVGVAVATLVTIIVSNLIFLPYAARSEFSFSVGCLIARGLSASGIGACIALIASLPILLSTNSHIVRLTVIPPTVLVAGMAAGALLLGNSGRADIVHALKRDSKGVESVISR